MKNEIVDTSPFFVEDDGGFEEYYGPNAGVDLPRQVNFHSGVDFVNQVFSFERFHYFSFLLDGMEDGMTTPRGKGRRKYYVKPSIVFGSRVTDKPVLDKVKNID